MWIALAAVAVGVVAGIWIPYELTPGMAPYVAVAIVAAIDSVFGGIAAAMKKQFNITVFFTGFFSNALLAAAIVYMGYVIGIDIMFLAVVVVFALRMFQNLAAMRYAILEKYSKKSSIPNHRNNNRKILHQRAIKRQK